MHSELKMEKLCKKNSVVCREDARWGAQGARAPQKFQILIYKSSPKKIPEKIYILGTLSPKILPSSLAFTREKVG